MTRAWRLPLVSLSLACSGAALAPAPAPVPASAPVTAAPASAPAASLPAGPLDPALVPQVLAAAASYKKFSRVDDQARVAPLLCFAPPVPAPVVSQSKDPGTHGRKLYTLYAKDADAYHALRPGAECRVEPGQVLVKESWLPVTVPQAEQDAHSGTIYHSWPYAKIGEVWHKADQLHGLFVMMRLDPTSPGADQGWVYGTVAPDLQTVTSAGKVPSCMGCHEKAGCERLFGLTPPR